MAVTAVNVLAARTKLMEQVIVLLERTKHGALARATRVQAEHLAMVAEGVDASVCAEGGRTALMGAAEAGNA